MHHYLLLPLSALIALALLHGPRARADEQSSERQKDEYVPLSQEDLRSITAQVMAEQPLLSSSPGIKYAEASRWRSEDSATVIYHPHSESAGIQQAFQVECTRQVPDTAWTCADAEIRRYLALDSQEFDVRVTGPIGSGAALALIEASRKLLPARVARPSDVPDTAMKLSSYDDGATVIWVNFEGNSYLMVEGQLAEGGDPTRPDDWIVHARECCSTNTVN